MRHILGAILVLSVMVLALPLPGGAATSVATIKTEIKTAAYHASELAQKGAAIAAVRLHGQHTINCLEGPAGMHFKAAAGYPCQGQGTGIIPDLQAAAASGVPGASAALEDAQIALKLALEAQDMSDMTQAQPWLKVTAKYLQQAYDALGMGM